MGKQPPVDVIQCGKVKIAIFVNKSSDGKYDVTTFAVTKNYKVGEEWKTTNSYTLQELADVQIAITQVQLKYRVKGNNKQPKSDEPAY